MASSALSWSLYTQKIRCIFWNKTMLQIQPITRTNLWEYTGKGRIRTQSASSQFLSQMTYLCATMTWSLTLPNICTIELHYTAAKPKYKEIRLRISKNGDLIIVMFEYLNWILQFFVYCKKAKYNISVSFENLQVGNISIELDQWLEHGSTRQVGFVLPKLF